MAALVALAAAERGVEAKGDEKTQLRIAAYAVALGGRNACRVVLAP